MDRSITPAEQRRIVSSYVENGDELIAICDDTQASEEQKTNAILEIRNRLYGLSLQGLELVDKIGSDDYALITRIYDHILNG